MECPVMMKVAAAKVVDKEKKKKRNFIGTALVQSGLTAPFTMARKSLIARSGIAGDVLGQYSDTQKFAPGTGKVYRYMKKKHKLDDLKVFRGDKVNLVSSYQGPHYNPSSKHPIPQIRKLMGAKGVHIRGASDPGILAHEIGHAADFKKFPKLKALARMAPMVTGLASINMLRDEDQAKYAPLVAMGGFAPTLWQEGKATRTGLKAVKKVLGHKQARTSARLLRKAFGTYASLPLAVGAGTFLASKLLHGKKKDKKD